MRIQSGLTSSTVFYIMKNKTIKELKSVRLAMYEKNFSEVSKQLKISEDYLLTNEYKKESLRMQEALEILSRAEKVHASALAEVINQVRYEEIFGGRRE